MPQAVIVYDLYHVVAKYGREVIDRVRVDEANRLRHDRTARKVANRHLTVVYVLKDDLKHLWNYTYVGAATRFFEAWYQRAIRSRIAPLKAFARHLKARVSGILAHCRYPLHTSLLEGVNNKIKVLKRMAYGYRDNGYSFLTFKMMDAFPGNPGVTG